MPGTVQFLCANDTAALNALSAEELSRCRNLVLPRYLHADPMGRTTIYFIDALMQSEWVNIMGSPPHLLPYILHTDPRHGEQDSWPDLPDFGRCRSVSDSLVAYLLHTGYRQFYTNGVEWDGTGDYHPLFTRKVPQKTQQHRISIWNHTRARLKRAGAKAHHWTESEWYDAEGAAWRNESVGMGQNSPSDRNVSG